MSKQFSMKGNSAAEAAPNGAHVKIELKEGYLYDPVAQQQRKATDEEFVRQEMIKTLVSEYGYSLTSMATEFPVKLGSATKKVDIAVFPDDAQHKQEMVEGEKVSGTFFAHIRRMVQTEKAQRGEVPKDLPKEVLEEIKRFGAVE
jgi:hypothetical protein